MKKKIILIMSIMLLTITGCGKEPITNSRFEKVMNENNFSITKRHEALSKSDVEYISSLTANNNDTITITYTMYKEETKPKQEIKGAIRIMNSKDSSYKSTLNYTSLYLKQDTGDNHCYIAIKNSMLHITYKDKDKEIVKKILKNFGYEDYIKKIS